MLHKSYLIPARRSLGVGGNHKSVLAILAVAILGIFAFLYFSRWDNVVPKVSGLSYGGQRITFDYTDSTAGENLIIKSEKAEYVGNNSSMVYFSITNTTDTQQSGKLTIYSDNKDTGIDRLGLWNTQGFEKMTTSPLASAQGTPPSQGGEYSPPAGGGVAVGQGGGSPPASSSVIPAEAGIQDSSSPGEGRMPEGQERSKISDSFSPITTSGFTVPAGQTKYYLVNLTYPAKNEGKFAIETTGDHDGYGLLNLNYTSGAQDVADDEYWVYLNPQTGDVIDIIPAKRGGGMYTQSKDFLLIKVKGQTDSLKGARVDLDALKSQNNITTEVGTFPEAIEMSALPITLNQK